ncbi:GNAT family N-acetyltransferase [Nocardia sp. CNY236]|uniref:GNAT family N-acetyltransferase n=1 Tax=Nocardia sp. CNY236 TaxID=1169152 RepID=UPI00048C5CED|nr:GNAT family N-acetyltransferase [Nocardia sp. CNY236]
MPIHVQRLRTPEDIRSALTIFRMAMVGLPPLPPTVAEFSEPGRVLGAYIDRDLVGTVESYAGWLVVPGGARVPQAAVSHVGVLPTHTRQGVLSALVRRQLIDIAERGEVVATLRASEGSIYERFGYGIASSFARLEVQRRTARLRDTVAEAGPVRFVEDTVAWKLLPRIYATADVRWPGAISRPDRWWLRQQAQHSDLGFVLVHGPDGAEDGFVCYQPADSPMWLTEPNRRLVVNDFVATTPAAYRGLMRHLLSIDLVDTVVFPVAPLDSPLRHLFADERAVRMMSIADETWLRVIDVTQALSRRTYREASPVVVEIEDSILPDNSGCYRISPDGVHRVRHSPDISAGIVELGAVYLGGTTWRDLSFAGRVAEHRPGAITAADALFGTDTAPFSGTFF